LSLLSRFIFALVLLVAFILVLAVLALFLVVVVPILMVVVPIVVVVPILVVVRLALVQIRRNVAARVADGDGGARAAKRDAEPSSWAEALRTIARTTIVESRAIWRREEHISVMRASLKANISTASDAPDTTFEHTGTRRRRGCHERRSC
jgi:hypothetical protein